MIRRLSDDEIRRSTPRPLNARAPREALATPPAPAAPELARKLRAFLDEELALAPERICALVDRELIRFHGAHGVRVRAHPDDLALLAPAELSARHELASPLTLEPDRSLHRGGCMIDAPCGEVDASIETRIARLLEMLLPGAA